MKRILFVCAGNTCRSPMAEAVMKSILKVKGIKGVSVKSAGLAATDGDKMSKNSQKALKVRGISAFGYGFKSKRLTREMVERADLVVTMTSEYRAYLSGVPNVRSVSEITGAGDIADPYGGSENEYFRALLEIEDACGIIFEKFIKG